MAIGNDGCNVLHTYYGMAQGKRVISLVTVKCNFVGKYVKPPEPIVPPILNSWVNEFGIVWIDQNNNKWEA